MHVPCRPRRGTRRFRPFASKALQAKLDRDETFVDMGNSARYVRGHARSNGKLGAVGFCFGGTVCHHLAVTLATLA
jgi:carboxymethylenebutenolidase